MGKKFDHRKGHLQVMVNELSSSIGSREKRYFHINTIENLIFHFEEIKTETDKNWIYETLQEYLRKCKELVPCIDRNISKELFYDNIDKLTSYYRDNLGFVVLINRSIVYLVYFVVLLLCYLFLNFYVLLVAGSFFAFQTIRVFKKYKEKKVYSLFW